MNSFKLAKFFEKTDSVYKPANEFSFNFRKTFYCNQT